jgi:hypothetical protein
MAHLQVDSERVLPLALGDSDHLRRPREPLRAARLRWQRRALLWHARRPSGMAGREAAHRPHGCGAAMARRVLGLEAEARGD